MRPEELLHLFAPYLPTDRFRALLRGIDLPTTSEGAALQVDIVGFTPMTTELVAQHGAQRACEELKRRLNPMFEAIAGQVFHHGGSVITFTGDGFVAWFDDRPAIDGITTAVPGLFRALAAGFEMQAVMPLFRGLQLKVCIGAGAIYRWVIGKPDHGLADVLLGPAVDAMNGLTGESQPGQVLVHRDALPALRGENVRLELAEVDHVITLAIPDSIAAAARRYRWPAWAVEGNIYDVLMATRSFIGATIRERVESGLGDFVAELRYAIPMFIRVGGIEPHTAEARTRLDSYICAMQDVMADYGGRCVAVEVTEKGTLVFGVFGAPIAHGNDAERAIRATLALRDIDAAQANGITQRFGLSRGLLYAGTIGGETRREYTIIGDETNIASRLMSAASDGQILTSTDVRAEVGSDILFNELSPIAVKGKTEPIPVIEPVAVRAVPVAPPAIDASLFVGRKNELAILDELLVKALAGMPQIARIEGLAGIGKTRLAAEFTQRSLIQRPLIVASGAAINIGRQMPYSPWRSVLTSLLRLNAAASSQETIDQLSALIEAVDSAWLSRLPLLGELLQLPIPETSLTAALDGQLRRAGLFALVTDLILSAARRQPVVIILDDIQWIDELSGALIVELARRLSVDPAPLLLLLMQRPVAQGEPLLAFIQAIRPLPLHTHLVLDELNRADVITLMENYLRVNAPRELADFIYERARGNPFFVLEVLGALIETRHIQVVQDTVLIGRDLRSTNLPHTVQGLVQARVDRLNDADRLVLKVAAVIGRQFQVRILAESIPVPMSYDELLTHLQSLEDRELSHRESAEPELSYVFTHAITQEVAYQSLLLAQRQQLHHAVAMALELRAPDAVEQLAYHFVRGGSAERALYYLVLAGQRAFREYANQAALDYFTQALELSVNEAQQFEIKRQRVQVMARLGDTAGIQAELPSMAQIAIHHHRLNWQAAVHLLTANYDAQISAWPRVIDQAQRAAALARQLDDKAVAWDAYHLLHSAFMAISQPDEAEWAIDSMQSLAAYLDDPRRSIELTLLNAETKRDQLPEQMMPGVQAALAQAQELGDTILSAACWATLMRLAQRANDLPAALEAARRQIVLLRQIGDRPSEGLTLNQIGIILSSLGQFSQSNDYLLDAYKILHQIGERSGEAISLVHLGVIAFHRRAFDEAIAYMKRGLVIQRDLNVEADAALTLFYMGNAYIGQENRVEASRCLGEARAFFWANHRPQQIDEGYTALAEIDILCGDLVSARAHIDPLLERLRQPKGYPLILPGLAYWRTIRVLEEVGETGQAALLRSVFRAESESILARLVDSHWRDAYVNNIWYHAALLTS